MAFDPEMVPAGSTLVYIGGGDFAWVPPGDPGDVWGTGTDGLPAWVPPGG